MQPPDRDDCSGGGVGSERRVLLAALAQRDEEGEDMSLGDAVGSGDPGRRQVLDIAAEVTAVGGDGVGRQSTLDRKVVKVGLQRDLERASAQRSTSSSASTSAPWASATGP